MDYLQMLLSLLLEMIVAQARLVHAAIQPHRFVDPECHEDQHPTDASTLPVALLQSERQDWQTKIDKFLLHVSK